MHSFFQTLAIILAIISVFASLMILTRLKQPASVVWWVVKVFVSALIPFFLLTAVGSVVLCFITGSLLLTLPGIFSTVIFFLYLYRVKGIVNSPTGLGHAYGPNWKDRIISSRTEEFFSSPITLTIPHSSAFVFQQDIPFCKLSGTSRELLCDLWTPAEGAQSGYDLIQYMLNLHKIKGNRLFL